MTTARITIASALLITLPAAPALAADGWGASWSFGPTTSRIIHARTTMVPGRLPPITSTTGPLFLWPGASNPTSNLIQTTMDAWQDNKGYCGAATGQWCVEASVFGSFGQRNGPTVAIDPDDHVTIDYKLGADGNTWTQTVSSQKLGKVVSTLTSTSGPMPKGGFGFATEADADSYTIDTQYYLCTELDLAEADPHFGATGVGGVGAQHGATGKGSGTGTAKNLRTPDGGLTWLVDLITLPAMDPQGTQTPAPAYDCSGSGEGNGGSSGTTSSGGSTGKGGSTGRGGTTGSGGTSDRGGSTASGGATATGGRSGSGGTAATGGSMGSVGSGGASTAATGGTSGSPVGSGGSMAIASGGTTGSGGRAGTGGTNQGSGGSVTAGSGGTSTGTGGAATGSAETATDAAGCNCVVGSSSRPDRISVVLVLGTIAMLANRRRNRIR